MAKELTPPRGFAEEQDADAESFFPGRLPRFLLFSSARAAPRELLVDAPTMFPRLRWACLLWLAVWLPTYAVYWGFDNFVQLCDIAAILTVAGVWTGNSLLLSSQAVGSLAINTLWTINILWRFFFGVFPLGGSEFMWDTHYPLWVRLLSFYHVAVPLVLLWALRRTGYDPRGWWLQVAISVPVLIASRFISPQRNFNFAVTDPLLKISFHPAALHLAIILFCLIAFLYWPAHRLLLRVYPPPAPPN